MTTRVRSAAALAALVLLALLAAGSAGAGARDREPPRPPQAAPTSAGLFSGAGTRPTHAGTRTDGGKQPAPTGGRSQGPGAPGAVGSTTLVLYDTTGQYGWLGELYAQYAANLASHFGSWKAEPVASYQAGQIGQYTATIYIGSTYDEPLPAAFLDDVHASTKPVIWIYDNIWELTNRYPDFQTKYGWMWSQFDTSTVSHVVYKGITLTRDGADNGAGIMNYSSLDPSKATVLAQAVRDADGSTFPWAVRSGNLTYVGENPFVYTGETDRVIAFEDLLYDALDPGAQARHRALVRLEDISPVDDTVRLRQIADYLYSQHIPFGFEFTPVYTDPTGHYNNGTPQTVMLQRNTDMASTLLYLESRGGTLVAHGLTHQYSNIPNPFTAVTGDDAEFYRLIFDSSTSTIDYAGPVSEDSASWAGDRMDAAQSIFKKAGVGTAQMWTFPDYVASAADYAAAAQRFPVRWERALYFGGNLTGAAIDYTHVIGETFPYVVRDVYGSTVLPENLGDYSPTSFYAFPPHTIDNILAAGSANLAVRDGFASFFYHPYEGLAPLEQIVDGLRAQGWSFASPTQVAQSG